MIRIGLYGYFHRGAYGDEIIRHCTRRMLSTAFAQQAPDVEYEFVDDLFMKRAHQLNEQKLDLLVLCGGSLLFSDPLIELVKANVPLCIFGTGYRVETLNQQDRIWMKQLIDIAEVVSVRGYLTSNWLREHGADIRILNTIELGDPALAYECTRNTVVLGRIGGNIRTDTQQWYLKPTAEAFMRSAYKWLSPRYELKLLPFRYEPSVDNDSTAITNAGYPVPESPLSLRETLNEVSKCEYWVGQRLHPFIIALCCGIKALGVGYQFTKLRDVCSVIDYPYWVLTTEPIQKFSEVFNKLVADDHIVAATQQRIARVCEGLQQVADRIVAVALA